MRRYGVNANGQPISSMYVDRGPCTFDLRCEDASRTRQEFKDECDINILMSRYDRNGVLPPTNGAEPQYLDVSNVPDLAQAFDIVEQASKAFFTLSAAVRREFDNDPIKFVAFAEDSKNLERMREWGLAPPAKVDPPPQKVEIVNSPQSAGATGASAPASPPSPA